jgi:hypothetical protein
MWDSLLRTQQAPETWVLVGSAVLALTVIVGGRSWRLARYVVTLVHEAGHAGMALLGGRRLHGIRLHSDTSGLTVTSGRPEGFGMVTTAAAGYPAPAALGLAAAALLTAGHVDAALWGFLALVAAVLVAVRNPFGLLTVAVTGGALIAVLAWGNGQTQGAAAYLLTWFLLAAAPRPVVELQRKRRRGRAPTSDADQLAVLTGVPGILWVGFFLVCTLGALALGSWWLLEPLVE